MAITDEELKRRPEFAGMPLELARIAATNLSREDSSVAKVNNVLLPAGPQEGFARVAKYQEPGTPATTTFYQFPRQNPIAGRIDHNAGTTNGAALNRSYLEPAANNDTSIGEAMDRANFKSDAPTVQDNGLTDDHPLFVPLQRAKLISQGIDPDAPAIRPSRRSGRGEGVSRFDVLQHEMRQTYQDLAHYSVAEAKRAHEILGAQTQAQVANGHAKLLQGIGQINEKYGHGTQAAQTAILNLAGSDDPDIAAARASKSFATLIGPHIKLHDDAAVTTERIRQSVQSYREAMGREPKSVDVTADGRVHMQGGADAKENNVPASVISRHARLEALIEKHEEDSAKEAKENTDAKQANVPYSKASDLHAMQKELSALKAKYPELGPEPAAAATPSAPPIVPKVDEVRGGYRFKGGDPSKEENWEKQ